MNKNYTSIFVLITILFFGMLSAQETQKNFINYQGVARNASNELMVKEDMSISIAVKFGLATAAADYEESHNITTDANGVFSLLIGNGNASVGNYNNLSWGAAATFVTVSINGKEIGTTEMMAVPYAISAGNIKDPLADEVRYDNSASGLSATTAQDAIDELVTGGSVDADADPSNEFQLLSFDAATNELSLSDGNSVTIPSGGTDADADPTNELQTISFDAALNKISLTDGGEITIPSGGTDADSDPENELQTLSFDSGTNELSLSDGNSITIPTGGTDADADPTNEIQDISLAGTELTISDGSTIDLAPIVPTGGTDNQELTFNETTKVLEIEDGNTVDLSSLSTGGGSSLWDDNEFGLNRPTGVVNLGHVPTAAADSKFFVFSSAPGIRNGIRSYVIHPGYKVGVSANALSRDGENTFGMRSSTTSESTGPAWAYRADMTGAGTGTKYAFYSRIPASTGGEKYGLYTDGEDKNYFSGDLGIGTETPTSKLDVDGGIRSRDLSGGGQRNVMADAEGNLVIGADGAGSSLWTENFDKISYEEGPVGIGTNSPERNTALHVKGKMFIETPGGLYLGDPDFGAQWLINKGSFDRNDLVFFTNSDAEERTYRSRIAMRREGEFQIGRTGIIGAGWLNVIENSSVSKPHIKIQEIEEDYARLEFKNSSQGFWHIAGRGGATGDVSRLNFYHHNGTSGRDYMTIAGSGNIGIGTTSPAAKLDVAGDIKTSGEVNSQATGNANMIPIAYGNIRNDGVIYSGSGNFTVRKDGAGRYLIRISGENYRYNTDFTTLATRNTGVPGFIGINALGASDLLVVTHNTGGVSVDAHFMFVVYKK